MKKVNYIFIIGLILCVCFAISSVSASDVASMDSGDSNSACDVGSVLTESPDNIDVVDGEYNVDTPKTVDTLKGEESNSTPTYKLTFNPTIKLKSSKISAFNGQYVKVSAKVVFTYNGAESYVGGGYLHLLKDGKSIKKVSLTKLCSPKYATLSFEFKKGHNYSLWYSGAKDVGEFGFNFSSVSKKIPISLNTSNIKTKLSSDDFIVKNHGYIEVELSVSTGNGDKLLANKKIIMRSLVSGKTYKIRTNKKGVARIHVWVKHKPLNHFYKYEFRYAGSKKYDSCSKIVSVKLINRPVKDVIMPTEYNKYCSKKVENYTIKTKKYIDESKGYQYVDVNIFSKTGSKFDNDEYKAKIYYKNKGDKTFKCTKFKYPSYYYRFRFDKSLEIGKVVVRFL